MSGAAAATLPRGADRALRWGAVAMAAGVIAEHAATASGAASLHQGGGARSAELVVLVGLGISALLAVTRWARVGMLGVFLTALAVDLAATWTATQGALLVLPCHAARWLGPLAFVVAARGRPGGTEPARLLLALAAAATFAGHGIKAFQAPPNFVAYLDCVCGLAMGDGCPDRLRAATLIAIGVADIAVAALVLRNRRGAAPALAWMVAWGGATAVVRCVHGGLEAWPLTAERVPNALVPLAALLLHRAATPAR
ncbi:MAG: hypothetical protein ACO4CZ_04260 [Planctomycetota bacterium]